MRTVSVSRSALKHQLARQPRRPRDVRGEVEQIVFFLAGARQAVEILLRDDHVAGRAGHRALAAALERLAVGLRQIEQDGARRGLDLAVELAIGAEEADAASCDHPLVARGIADAAAGRGQFLFARVAPEAQADRAARLAVAQPERAQHVAWPPRPRGAGRAERESDVAQVGDQPRAVEAVAAQLRLPR